MGCADVDKLTRDIGTPEKLLEWRAFYLLEPKGSEWESELFGTVAATVANVNKAAGSKAFDWKFFFRPKFGFRKETLKDIEKRLKSYLPIHMNPDFDEMRLKAFAYMFGKPAEPDKE